MTQVLLHEIPEPTLTMAELRSGDLALIVGLTHDVPSYRDLLGAVVVTGPGTNTRQSDDSSLTCIAILPSGEHRNWVSRRDMGHFRVRRLPAGTRVELVA